MLKHIQERGHVWLIVLTVVAVVVYMVKSPSLAQSEGEFTANIVLCLVAAASVVSGFIALLAMAWMNKTQLGELDSFKFYLIIGTLVGVMVSAVKLLELFGILKFAR